MQTIKGKLSANVQRSMHSSPQKEKDVRTTVEGLHEPTECPRSGQLHAIKYQEHNLNGINILIQGQVMQQTVETQKNLMKHVDLDRLEDIRDEMEEMKFQSDYTNELLNRNFDVELDDIDLDAEMQEIDNDFYKEVMTKNPQKAVNVPQQQMNNFGFNSMKH